MNYEDRECAARRFVAQHGQFLSCGLWENPYWIFVVTWAKKLKKSGDEKLPVNIYLTDKKKKNT